MKKLVLVLCCLGSWSVFALENAAVFTANAQLPTLTSLQRIAGNGTVTEEEKDGRRLFRCQWPGLSITVGIDPDYDFQVQRKGLSGWLRAVDPNSEHLAERARLQPQVDNVRQCYPCIVDPAFDDQGVAFRFVTHLARLYDGFIFAHQSMYGTSGGRLLGRPGDPLLLGPVGAQSLAADGSPLRVSEELFHGKWRSQAQISEEELRVAITADEQFNPDRQYGHDGVIVIAAADGDAMAAIEYKNTGAWKVDGHALYLKSLTTDVRSAKAVEGFPIDAVTSKLQEPDEAFDRWVIVQVRNQRLFLQGPEGLEVRMERP